MDKSSYNYTKYSSLTNEELLSQLELIKHKSPIISELYDRMLDFVYPELLNKPEPIIVIKNNIEFSCPVCETSLFLNQDEDDKLTITSEKIID